jgi:hypothetical protein
MSSTVTGEHRVNLPHPECLTSGAPRGPDRATEPQPLSGGMAGTCLDPGCRSCTDCPSCVGGTARIPTDFRVVHHADGSLTAYCTRCQGSGTLGCHSAAS